MGLLEGAIAGIGPALVAFFLTFDSYDRIINDRGLFIALFVGMILGYVFLLPELLGVFTLDPVQPSIYPDTSPLFHAGVSVFSIAFFQEGLRTLVMNLPAIRGRWQQPFWGMSLGLGSGAVAALIIIVRFSEFFTLQDFVANFPFVVALVLAHSAFGGILGLGISELRAVRGFFIASVGHMVFNGLILLERGAVQVLSDPLVATMAHWVFVILLLAYALVLYVHMVRQLPKMLPKDKQTERRRMLREAKA